MNALSVRQSATALRRLPQWAAAPASITRAYEFADFLQSIAFVRRVADAAEEANHHPDILIRWNRVTLTLSTHDAGGLTPKDFALAALCDRLAVETGKPAPRPRRR
jgi:4a-hydroxytetrahydrobiopterin dehydratase